MRSGLVYLAGPISGQTFDGATGWREYAIEVLAEVGITALSPMRQEEYLEEHQLMPDMPDCYGTVPVNIGGVVARDAFDIRRSDLTLMNLTPARTTGKVSIGSMNEAGIAYQARKPLIVCMTEDNPHWHGFFRGIATYIVDDIESGLHMVKSILLPGHKTAQTECHFNQSRRGY